MKCEDCFYFESIGDGSCGSCHESSPDNDGQGQNTIDEFPVVKSGEWCGKHKKKGKKK